MFTIHNLVRTFMESSTYRCGLEGDGTQLNERNLTSIYEMQSSIVLNPHTIEGRPFEGGFECVTTAKWNHREEEAYLRFVRGDETGHAASGRPFSEWKCTFKPLG
jgi:hypothetical protein